MKRRAEWKEWLIGKTGMILLSLALSLSIWISINSGQDVDENRSVKIQYTRMPNSLTFERVPLREVPLTLKGPLYRLRGLADENLAFIVDMSSYRAGANRVELTLDSLKLPVDIQASLPSIRSFMVHLEEFSFKSLPVKTSFVGTLDEGLSIGQVKVNPPIVSVSGPKSVMDKLENIPVEIDVQDKYLNFSFTAKPNLAAPSTSIKETILIDVEITAMKSHREYESVPVNFGGLKNVRVEPTLAKLRMEGPERELRSSTWQPEITLNLKGLRRGRYLLRGQVNAPENFKLISIEPQNFLVEVLQ